MRTRRSGISNLVGVVFFVLVTGLVLSTLLVLFENTSGFVGGIHSNANQGLSNSQTLVQVQNLAFGATYSKATSSIGINNTVSRVPLLPVTNMNLTGSDSGWYVSESFPTLHENASLTNTNTTSVVLPSVNGFVLSVTNTDPLGRFAVIAKVSLIVDSNLTKLAALPPSLAWTVTEDQTGKNITWSTPAISGIAPSGNVMFDWSAKVPATVGRVYDTVVVTWYQENPHFNYIATGIATVNTNTTAYRGNLFLSKGTSSASIKGYSMAKDLKPGGLTAGYDGHALTTTSGSGPGSLYIDYQPTINSSVVPMGQQVTGSVTFTAPFTLQSNVLATGCCTVSWQSSLDGLTSSHNPLIVYNVVIQNSTGATWTVLVNTNGTNPTLINYFKPTGWHSSGVALTPGLMHGATTLERGSYNLIVSVNMTIPGGSTSDLLVHFDDLGISVTPAGGDVAYGSQHLLVKVGSNQSQIQGIELGVNVTGGISPGGSPMTPNSTAYLFAGDLATGSERWQMLGQAVFNTSTEIQATVPLPNAAYYVSPTGYLDLLVRVVSPFAPGCAAITPSTCPSLALSLYAVVSSTNQTRGVVLLQGVQGAAPVQLISLYVQGSSGLTTRVISNFVNSGDFVIIPLTNFQWFTGQTYVVTVTTTNGLTFSKSFSSPTA